MSNVENNSRKKRNLQNTCKKRTSIFWFPVKDIKIADIFYKILKILGPSWASVIAHKHLLLWIIWFETAPYKTFLWKVFCSLIILFWRYWCLKLELEARTILATTPSGGPNIYICCPMRRSGKILDRHDRRSKIYCDDIHIMLFCTPHHSNWWSPCWTWCPGATVWGIQKSLPLLLLLFGVLQESHLSPPSRICINFRRFPNH